MTKTAEQPEVVVNHGFPKPPDSPAPEPRISDIGVKMAEPIFPDQDQDDGIDVPPSQQEEPEKRGKPRRVFDEVEGDPKFMPEEDAEPDKELFTDEDLDDEDLDDSGDEDTGEEESAEEPEDSQIDADLIAKANEVGISTEEAKSVSPETLKSLISRIAPDQQDAPKQEESRQEKAEESEAETVPESFDLSEHIDEDLWDPESVKALKAMDKFYQGKMKSLEEQVGAVLQDSQAQKASAYDSQFVGMLREANEDVQGLLGTKSTSQMDRRTTEYKNRVAVFKEMDLIVNGYVASGQEPPSEPELFKRACNALFADQMSNQQVNRLARKVKQRSRQALGKPNGKPVDRRNPDAAATDYVKNRMREFGLDED